LDVETNVLVRDNRCAFSRVTTIAVAVAVVAAGCGAGSNSRSAETSSNASTPAGNSGGTLITLANAAPSGSPDPQVNYTLQEWQFLMITHDGLVAFKRVGGRGGTKLVPDLATSIPTPTDGGRTWTFTLRPGIKFSNGQTLTPNDVKATFERLFKIGDSPNAATWYSVIAGGDACLARPKTCNLSKGIVIKGNTITFHLTRPDPEFLDQLAMPFALILPASTPAKNVDLPPPGTGPYKWVQYAPNKQLKVVRNPYFHLWSSDAQPEGLPDAIVQKFGLSVEAEVTQVENGSADWIYDPVPSDRLNELSTKYASQIHVDPLTSTYYFALNTRVPPFDNVQVRRAVNYATDRNALVKIYGGPKLATATCQVLPPNFPGYEPYCPYTKNPGSGKWTAPDVAKARQLIAQSGTKGMAVKVTTDTTDVDKGFGEYFIGLLNSLGYKASPQFLAADLEYPYIQNSKNKVQFAFSNWSQDYPAASDFLNVLLGCGSFHPNSNSSPNVAELCDKRIQAKMDQAGAAGARSAPAADKLWATVDRDVTDQAPRVAMFNPKYLDFVSARIKGFQFSPQWYFLVDQASVK
jgi:peptide/nickel transport system substrate-binding protein